MLSIRRKKSHNKFKIKKNTRKWVSIKLVLKSPLFGQTNYIKIYNNYHDIKRNVVVLLSHKNTIFLKFEISFFQKHNM